MYFHLKAQHVKRIHPSYRSTDNLESPYNLGQWEEDQVPRENPRGLFERYEIKWGIRKQVLTLKHCLQYAFVPLDATEISPSGG